jgi:uncharacterized damage-inducible protein DinB
VTISSQIAKQFREVYFGGNWTSVNFRDVLSDVNWIQATTKVNSFNTIAALIFHTNYYVSEVLKVLKGGTLEAHDKYSFNVAAIDSAKTWTELLDKMWKDAEEFARLVEELPETKLSQIFSDPKYGTYYRNLHGIIEHNHYHLGQIVLIKKLFSK